MPVRFLRRVVDPIATHWLSLVAVAILVTVLVIIGWEVKRTVFSQPKVSEAECAVTRCQDRGDESAKFPELKKELEDSRREWKENDHKPAQVVPARR